MRRAEIEQAVFTRIYAIADQFDVTDPEYEEGLRSAVSTATDYGLRAIERGEERAPRIPSELLAQARIAARSRIGLDTIIRRYFAGYTLLSDFLIEEAELDTHTDRTDLKHLLRAQATLFDQLLTAISNAHTHEKQFATDDLEQRRVERVRRLLGGELLDISSFAYEFDAYHLGVVTIGQNAPSELRHVAKAMGCRILSVRPRGDISWAWLASRRSVPAAELATSLLTRSSVPQPTAIGQSSKGLAGWRLTHMQARSAMGVVLRGKDKIVCYADSPLLASALEDKVLTVSLQTLLGPVEDMPDGGKSLLATLQAYIAGNRSISSTAVIRQVSRPTIRRHLKAIEALIGKPVDDALPELGLALSLREIGAIPVTGPHSSVSPSDSQG